MNVFFKPIMLAEISRDIGLVFFASLFVGPLTSDIINKALILSGLGLSFAFWIISLFLAKD